MQSIKLCILYLTDLQVWNMTYMISLREPLSYIYFAQQGYRDGYHVNLTFSNFLSAEPLGTYTLYIA